MLILEHLFQKPGQPAQFQQVATSGKMTLFLIEQVQNPFTKHTWMPGTCMRSACLMPSSCKMLLSRSAAADTLVAIRPRTWEVIPHAAPLEEADEAEVAQ